MAPLSPRRVAAIAGSASLERASAIRGSSPVRVVADEPCPPEPLPDEVLRGLTPDGRERPEPRGIKVGVVAVPELSPSAT